MAAGKLQTNIVNFCCKFPKSSMGIARENVSQPRPCSHDSRSTLSLYLIHDENPRFQGPAGLTISPTTQIAFDVDTIELSGPRA